MPVKNSLRLEERCCPCYRAMDYRLREAWRQKTLRLHLLNGKDACNRAENNL